VLNLQGGGNNPNMKFPIFYDRAISMAPDWLEAFEYQLYFVPKDQLYAQIYGLMNQESLELAHYDSARAMLEFRIEEQAEDSQLHSALGIAYAGLGRKEEAIREGKLAVELLPISKEAHRGTYRATDLAQIYSMVGEADAAIDQIEHLLSIPSPLSVALLRLDPIWDPLRDHPRFQRLIGGES
jgi:tetratricopeptide (TPR) repeat protein